MENRGENGKINAKGGRDNGEKCTSGVRIPYPGGEVKNIILEVEGGIWFWTIWTPASKVKVGLLLLSIPGGCACWHDIVLVQQNPLSSQAFCPENSSWSRF